VNERYSVGGGKAHLSDPEENVCLIIKEERKETYDENSQLMCEGMVM